MQIRETKIFCFGKLQQREYRFEPGINVIYGPNEAGKSTLHAFLLAMLFGMEKNRGRSAAKEGYLRYEPWHTPAYYSGALRFVVGERPFYLERNFYHKEKREVLRNEADGENLSVACGDLTMLLGGIGKETFVNTYDIPQSGAATGKELAGVLSEYLSDAAEGGGGGTHVTRAIDILNAKKRGLNIDLRKVQERKLKEREVLQMEEELLRRDCSQLKEELKKIMQAPEGGVGTEEQTQDLQEKAAKGSSVHQGKWGGLFLAGMMLAGIFANGWIFGAHPYTGLLFWGLQCLFGALAVGALFLTGKHIRKSQREQEKYAEPDAAAAKKQAEGLLAIVRDSLEEKETRLYNIKEQVEALELPGEREQELMTDIRALSMAAEEIENLAREFCEEIEDTLNSEVSRYVSAITDGKYDSVRVDEKGNLSVLTDGMELPPDALSRGTLEQFYLALRLAVGNIVTGEEPMPIFLDEAFSMYDDKRLEQALKVLWEMNGQVLLFTCQKREMELLEQMGVPYHKVIME